MCRNARGVQILFWNFTSPITKESDQKLFVRDLPSRAVGPGRISVAGVAPGNYQLTVYRVGYHVNDVYSDYLRLGSPSTLQRQQLLELAQKNDGRPIETARIRIIAGKDLTRDLALRENDVCLTTLESNYKMRVKGK